MDEDKASKLADRLGADRIGTLSKRPAGIPLGLLQLRDQVQDRLRSSGGRPTDPSWTVSRQVPFKPETWDRLQQAAEELGSSGRRVGAAQVAAVLLEREVGTGITDRKTVEELQSLKPLTVTEAANMTGITYRQLDHWCRKGWLSIAEQSGRHRTLAPEELIRAIAMARLAGLGAKGKERSSKLTDLDMSKHFLVINLEDVDDPVKSLDVVHGIHDELVIVIDLEVVREGLLRRFVREKRELDADEIATERGSAAV
jgi:hypothetical protein